jgi:hypothetical protein
LHPLERRFGRDILPHHALDIPCGRITDRRRTLVEDLRPKPAFEPLIDDDLQNTGSGVIQLNIALAGPNKIGRGCFDQLRVEIFTGYEVRPDLLDSAERLSTSNCALRAVIFASTSLGSK